MVQPNSITQTVPRIRPLEEYELLPELASSIEALQAQGILSSTTAVRIWAHRPQLALAWLGLMESFYTNSTLSERLRELIRLRIAAVTNCQACRLSRKSDTVSEADIACIADYDPRFSKAEQCAMDFAARLAGNHDTVSDETFAALEAEYSAEQIVEINMFSAFMIAGGRMTYAQQAY